jgi:hypothetical protein
MTTEEYIFFGWFNKTLIRIDFYTLIKPTLYLISLFASCCVGTQKVHNFKRLRDNSFIKLISLQVSTPLGHLQLYNESNYQNNDN